MVEGFSHGGSRIQHRGPESSGQSRDSCRRRLGASGLSQAAGESLSRHPARPSVFRSEDPESNTEDLRARVKAEILAAADSVQVAFRKPPAKVSPGTPPAQVS